MYFVHIYNSDISFLKCGMALIEPMQHNKSHIIYLFLIWVQVEVSSQHFLLIYFMHLEITLKLLP